MSLLQDFIEVSKEQGINTADLYQEQGDGFSIVSFGESGERNIIYNIALVFYDNDDDVEVFIRKQINDEEIVKVFNQINNLNAEYRGVTFYLEDKIVVLKSYVQAKGKIEVALKQMVGCMQIAQEVFPGIK